MAKHTAKKDNTQKTANLEEFSRNMAVIAHRSQELIKEFVNNLSSDKTDIGENVVASQLSAVGAFNEALASMIEHPEKLAMAYLEFYNEYLKLLSNTHAKMNGKDVADIYAGDKRFRDEVWNENIVFDFIKQSYLLTSNWLMNSADKLDADISEDAARKLEFYTRQVVEATSPSNFFMTNPEVLRETVTSNGENLAKGLENLLEDLKDSKGWLNIRMADDKTFTVGKNLAATEGKVIYQNDLMQLIQYDPSTKQVYKTPLLVVSAWINKYYILDMNQESSLIKWLVDKGHTVFAVSWVNPDEKLAKKSFDDYMLSGPIAAIDEIIKVTGEKEVNVISYCLGGTLMSATLAYLEAKKQSSKVKSATFLTSLTDFSKAGDLKVFIDDIQLTQLEEQMKERGYLDGKEMGIVFNMLRASDLIWSFVVNNYMLGKDPFPFDLLYWNSDSTRLPAEMHSFYLRKMYRDNLLCKAGGLELNGVKIDLSKVKTPSYFLSTAEDHIAPWKATYAATNLFSGPIRFVLGASGHVAGVINPPAAKRYGYRTGQGEKYSKNPDEWLKKTKEHKGSWWDDWQDWVTKNKYAGAKVAARKIKNGIEPAPGSYVRVKST